MDITLDLISSNLLKAGLAVRFEPAPVPTSRTMVVGLQVEETTQLCLVTINVPAVLKKFVNQGIHTVLISQIFPYFEILRLGKINLPTFLKNVISFDLPPCSVLCSAIFDNLRC